LWYLAYFFGAFLLFFKVKVMNDLLAKIPNILLVVLGAVFMVVLAFGVGLILRFILIRALRLIKYKKAPFMLRSLVRRLSAPICFLPPFVAFMAFVPALANNNTLQLPTETVTTLTKLAESGFTAVLTWLFVMLVYVLQDYVYQRYDLDNEETKNGNLHERQVLTQFLFIKRFIIITIVFVGGAVALLNYDSLRQVGATLLTSAGILGIILGVAAQKSIANLVAGFQIAFTQPIRIDDVVIVEGEWGRIEELTFTYVVVRIWDQRRLVVPITYFVEKPFQNWTRQKTEIMGTVNIYADYTLPLAPLRKEMERILAQSPYWDGRVGKIQITDSTEKTMLVRCLVSASNSDNAWELRCELREKLIDFIQRHYPDCLPNFRASVQNMANE